mmetsp:Transcript_37263/g.48193  ORF Transcript_37263/g.48193 Transcript_37263/m.48193 type:complete len:471 (+) Transcript_37263:18-1430(+)
MAGIKALALALCFKFSVGRISSLHKDLRWLEDFSDSVTYCDEPVVKEQVIFPDSLAGRTNQNYDMFSGYINITEQDWLFYWFFEADSTSVNYDNPDDIPLIIWTNGGPGCSAMEGATTENGPLVLYRIKESYELATGQLSDNPYAWNKQGHVLYVDQPRYVGNSFGYGDKCKSSVSAANDIVTFIQGWYDVFPEYSKNNVVIAGESYGGHYIPAWANAIMDHNEAIAVSETALSQGEYEIPMVGIGIGNGCVNDTVQDDAKYIEFLHDNNLIPSDATPSSESAANAQMQAYIGYDPNFYDFRVRDVSCSGCYSYNYTEWSYWFLKQEVIDALHICGDAGYSAFSGSAGGCIPMIGFDFNDQFDYSESLGRALNANISVMFYYGKNDLACNYVGAYEMATTLPWSGKDSFAATPLVPFGDGGGRTFGQAQQFRGEDTGALIWTQVDSAGHMVPLDEPPAAAAGLAKLLAAI